MALNTVVVSDSTTLISLMNIERFELLFDFSDSIMITPAVYKEVGIQKSAKRILDEMIASSKITVETSSDTQKIKELLIGLDLGESESIVLAQERNLPLIIDEKRGKKVAQRLGVETIGLVGILLIYKRKGILCYDELKGIVDELKSVDFRISFTLIALLLE